MSADEETALLRQPTEDPNVLIQVDDDASSYAGNMGLIYARNPMEMLE